MTQLAGIEVATPTPFEISFKRIYGVSRARLFDAWTQAEHVRQWWDPRGKVLAACEIDLRVGGQFKFVNQPIDGVTHEFAGMYLEFLVLGAWSFRPAARLPSARCRSGT